MLALALTVLPILQGGQNQPPDPGNLAAWRDHIAPHATETRWQEIAWQGSISAGIQAAIQTKRPTLLWLMNGHPLRCT